MEERGAFRSIIRSLALNGMKVEEERDSNIIDKMRINLVGLGAIKSHRKTWKTSRRAIQTCNSVTGLKVKILPYNHMIGVFWSCS